MRIHIGLTKFLEDDTYHAKYHSGKRFRRRYTGLNQNDSAKIKKAIAADNDNKNKIKDLKKKNKQLRRKKLRQNRGKVIAKAKTR